MSLLDDVHFLNKYNREEACGKILIVENMALYKFLEEGDDPISNIL